MWIWGADSVQTSFNGDPRSKLSDLINGSADNPFAQRVLIPALTRSLHQIIPAGLLQKISSGLMNSEKFRKEALRLGWELDYLPQYLIALALAYISLVGFVFTIRGIFRRLYETDEATGNILPLLALMGLPPFFQAGTHYIYDFPCLFLFSLGFLIMLTRKWGWFYLVFLLGVLNKETIVLLTLLFSVHFFRHMSRKALIGHVFCQVLIFAAVKGFLMHAFAGNPGSGLEFHLFGNIHNILMPYSLQTLLLAGVVIVLTVYDIGKKPLVLRQAAWLVIPFGILIFCFAWLQEVRDAYEVFPFYFLLMMHTILFSLFKIPYKLKTA